MTLFTELFLWIFYFSFVIKSMLITTFMKYYMAFKEEGKCKQRKK